MIYLKVRKINIDVIPGDPFVSIIVDKVITDGAGNITQTIGNFDRIYQRASSIQSQDAGMCSADGVIDNMELFNFVATAAYLWVIEKHGGTMINGLLVIEP